MNIFAEMCRYTHIWVNRRSKRAFRTGRMKLYKYYYRTSWQRFTNNYWPKEPPYFGNDTVYIVGNKS